MMQLLRGALGSHTWAWCVFVGLRKSDNVLFMGLVREAITDVAGAYCHATCYLWSCFMALHDGCGVDVGVSSATRG